MRTRYEQLLDQAATLWGITPEFWDIWGNLHLTSPETKKAILRAMGVAQETEEDLASAIKQKERAEWTRLVPHCLVISENARPREFPLHGPDSGEVTIEFRSENGVAGQRRYSLAETPVAQWKEIGGVRYGRRMLPVPGELRLGYYDVMVRLNGAAPDTMRLIVTPDRAYLPETLRAAGVAISLYGVRSKRNWGCGDFRDLHDVIDWASAEFNLAFVALNPLHAIHNRKPFNTSPYLPNSIFYQNLLYLDLEAIEDFQKCARAQKLWAQRSTQEALDSLRRAEFVEYEQVHAWKLRFLKLAFIEFLREYREATPRVQKFRQFIESEGELLERFATYSALDEWLHTRCPDLWIWPDWPEPYRDPDSAETRTFRQKHWRRVLFYQYVQWQIDGQLAETQEYARSRGMRVGLNHDLALATDRCGSDLWAHREFYVSGCRVGSPPDDFAPKGQDWGFPPPNSAQHRRNGYRLFARSIRNNVRHGGALRIDHVMRLFRLYWIPDGMDAAHGAYVRDRYEDLVRILALESVLNQVVLIGEDLGTVEPGVRETLQQFGILTYRLFYFERDQHGRFLPPDAYPVRALVSSTTHDLPTLAGFWINEDIEARRAAGVLPEESYWEQLAARTRDKQLMLDALFALGLLPDSFPRSATQVPELTGELHNAVIGFLAAAPSQLLLVNQEDLTKETKQQNLPGTTWQYPNWSRKMRFTVEELRTEQQARDFAAMFRNWLARTNRV